MEADDLLCSCNARSRTPLARATGTSREIECEAIGGWAGEEYLTEGGRVRKSRAVEDQSAPIPRKKTSKLGGEHVYHSIRVVKGNLATPLEARGGEK